MTLEIILIATLIVVVLAAVATKLQWQVYKQNKQATMINLRGEATLRKNRENAVNSLNIIARAYLADQAELAESSLRVHHLLNFLGVDDKQRETFVAFDKVANALAHIPTHDEWKALPNAEQSQHQKTIERVEREFSIFAKDSARALSTFSLT